MDSHHLSQAMRGNKENFVAQQFRSQSTTPENGPGSVSSADVVGDEAARVGQSVKGAGDHVVQAAAGQARQVAAETTQQAQSLLAQGPPAAAQASRLPAGEGRIAAYYCC
jgi:hypothetical protein